MKAVYFLILAAFVALLLYASTALPRWGSPTAPINRDTSAAGTPGAAAYYIRNAATDAATPNMVTVVLADYRGFDTLGETLVVFTAGMACCFLLRRPQA